MCFYARASIVIPHIKCIHAACRPFADAVAAQYVLQRLSNVPESVRPSHHSTAAAACGGFAAERRAIFRQRRAPSSKRGQCHVDSRRRRGCQHRLASTQSFCIQSGRLSYDKITYACLADVQLQNSVHSVHMFRTGIRPTWLRTYTNGLTKKTILLAGLQCFEAVGWATGRASDL